LSLSEHEGFGMPIIEAMNYKIPVLAYDSGAIPSTLGKNGLLKRKILLKEFNYINVKEF
ncbi:glycosyltransferase, partial [Arcobacter sp. F2176]|uniref:glycosyltransferase n=1 Tax=Arcobacter sp. F2176 TaxID=2044511 RepID=UPI00100C26A8